jgi:DNA-binding transcriptional LysR family regulator
LPELVRSYKARYPSVKLKLQEFSPFDQEVALDQEAIDIGFTRTLTGERS